MKKFCIVLITIGLLCSGCTSSNRGAAGDTVLPASSLHPFGRTELNESKHIELISSAAHLGFSFTGLQCEISAYIADEAGHNYLQYELDGTYQRRVKISGNDKQPVVITAAENGTHTV